MEILFRCGNISVVMCVYKRSTTYCLYVVFDSTEPTEDGDPLQMKLLQRLVVAPKPRQVFCIIKSTAFHKSGDEAN